MELAIQLGIIMIGERRLSFRDVDNDRFRQTSIDEHPRSDVAVSALVSPCPSTVSVDRKIMALYQRWRVSIPTTKSSTRWEDDFKRIPFGGLFEEYLEMGRGRVLCSIRLA